MPTISETRDYNGVDEKIRRLKLSDLVAETIDVVTGLQLVVEERKHANGTRGLRQTIDLGFESLGGWQKIVSGGIDWRKQSAQGSSIGVEVQVSGRSDMLAVDILHLGEAIVQGTIDVGLIVVPDDTLSRFLTDRTPNLATAIRHINHRASDLPIRVLAFRHDGVGAALDKMRTNLGKKRP